MSGIDLHPDDLIDRRLSQACLSAGDRRRLDEHLEHCADCVIEAVLQRDFGVLLKDDESDETSAAGHATARSTPERTLLRRRTSRIFAAAAVIVLALFTGSVATALLVAARERESPVTRPAPERPGPARAHLRTARPAAATVPLPATATPSATVLEPLAPRARTFRSRGLSAGELYAEAQRERSSGNTDRALQLYRRLAQWYPGSREELTSRVVRAGILLRRDEAERALALFEAYLDAQPRGTLAEEARFGRASALRQLGRRDAERRAWRELLAAHPNTPRAAEARARMLDEDGDAER